MFSELQLVLFPGSLVHNLSPVVLHHYTACWVIYYATENNILFVRYMLYYKSQQTIKVNTKKSSNTKYYLGKLKKYCKVNLVK